jgi:hypothetical protein
MLFGTIHELDLVQTVVVLQDGEEKVETHFACLLVLKLTCDVFPPSQ